MSITETPTVESIHRQHDGSATSEHHSRHSSKRKFDDCDAEDDQVSARRKKDTETTSSRLQFFVRMMSEGNSLVIQASGEETVESVHKRIERMTGIPVRHQRLIYKGKQLRCEESVDECGIQNDASVQLVGHLQSGGSPVVWQVMDNMVSIIYRLCRGEFVHDAPRNIQLLMTLYFNKPEYFSAFMSLKAPSVLVTLYVSPYAGNRALADYAIRCFLGCCRGSYSNGLQDGCLDVLLEFCRLLRRVGANDPLYLFCRGGFTSLLETLDGGVWFWNPARRVLLQGVFSFVRELADGLLKDLDLSMVRLPGSGAGAGEGPRFRDVHDFTAFLVHLRNGIRGQQALGGSVIAGNCHQEDPLIARVVDHLRVMYVQLLSKMDECLHCMEDCLANKEQGEGEGEGDGGAGDRWSQYLSIMKELYQISKLYDGAGEKFWRVLLHRRSMLSQLIVRYAKITDDYQWVLEHKTVTNFESRRHLAMMLFPDVKDDFGEVHEMFIDRSQLLAESFKNIARADPQSLQGGLFMEFKNEDASGPGVLREWFLLVCQAIFNPRNDLFVACPNDRRRFFPNAASKVYPRHLEYFSFCGRIIALALMNRVQVGIVFDRVFLMQLAGNYITLEDIQDADPTLYNSWKQILEMDADIIDSDALGLTFVREVEELGYRKVIELCPGGKSLVVNSKNREKYVDLLIQNYFVTSISEQVSHFAKGFADIISSSRMRQFFQILELEDLDWMLHGSENAISVEDWKAHTEYNGYKETDCQISWFWEIVGGMSAEQRKVLLFFWTSMKYLPVEGFHGLASRLYISKSMEPDDHLPSSHTCFYQLSFPPYSSMAIMQDRLGVITQEHISCSFGTW